MYERDSLRIEAAVSGSFGVNSSSTLAGGKVKKSHTRCWISVTMQFLCSYIIP